MWLLQIGWRCVGRRSGRHPRVGACAVTARGARPARLTSRPRAVVVHVAVIWKLCPCAAVHSAAVDSARQSQLPTERSVWCAHRAHRASLWPL